MSGTLQPVPFPAQCAVASAKVLTAPTGARSRQRQPGKLQAGCPRHWWVDSERVLLRGSIQHDLNL